MHPSAFFFGHGESRMPNSPDQTVTKIGRHAQFLPDGQICLPTYLMIQVEIRATRLPEDPIGYLGTWQPKLKTKMLGCFSLNPAPL
jgi:hypothetical protein